MSVLIGTDYATDPHRHDPDVHYRLYLHPREGVTVVCVQDFDYPHYDERRFLTSHAWDTEELAEAALLLLYVDVSLLYEVFERRPPSR